MLYGGAGRDISGLSQSDIDNKVEEQTASDSPVSVKELLPHQCRHRCSSSSIEDVTPEYSSVGMISIELVDYAVPSFISSSQLCFGTRHDIDKFCLDHDLDSMGILLRGNARRIELALEDDDMNNKISVLEEVKKEAPTGLRELFERAMNGDDDDVRYACHGACLLVPDASPRVLAAARVRENDIRFVHYNVWNCTYEFFADSADIDVIWVSMSYHDTNGNIEQKFIRAYRTAMNGVSPIYLGNDLFRVKYTDKEYNGQEDSRGYPKRKVFTPLFVSEKMFDSEEFMKEDAQSFMEAKRASEIDLEPFFALTLGDG